MCFEVKNIMYLMNFIQDVYNGQLIIKKIIDVYFFKCCIYLMQWNMIVNFMYWKIKNFGF